MFDNIRKHKILAGIECHDCCENNAAVEFCETFLLNDGYLNYEKVLLLKPDSYYHSSRIHNPPPSPDCLILLCTDQQEKRKLYLIELKDVKDTTELKYEIIVEKFQTMINKFFPEFITIFNINTSSTTCTISVGLRMSTNPSVRLRGWKATMSATPWLPAVLKASKPLLRRSLTTRYSSALPFL